jgi:hypothetical protein
MHAISRAQCPMINYYFDDLKGVIPTLFIPKFTWRIDNLKLVDHQLHLNKIMKEVVRKESEITSSSIIYHVSISR